MLVRTLTSILKKRFTSRSYKYTPTVMRTKRPESSDANDNIPATGAGLPSVGFHV